MTRGSPVRLPEPWLWPLCAFLFVVPFEELIYGMGLGIGLNLLGLFAALCVALGGRKSVRPAHATALATTGLFITLCLSYFGSLEPAATKAALMTIGFSWLTYVLATSRAVEDSQLGAAIGCWVLGACAAAAMVVVAGLTGQVGSDGRPTLLLGSLEADPNYFSAGLAFPFAFALYVAGRRGSLRFAGFAAAALLAGAVALTMSRGGALAFSAAFLVTLAYQRRWKTAAAFVALGAAGAYYLAASIERFDLSRDPTGAGRTEIWRIAADTGASNLTSGVGLDALPVITASAPGFYWAREPHSLYFQAFSEAGILALLALLAVMAAHLFAGFRAARAQAVLAGLGAVFFAGVFLHLLAFKVLWTALLVAAMAYQSRGTEPSGEHPEGNRNERRRDRPFQSVPLLSTARADAPRG